MHRVSRRVAPLAAAALVASAALTGCGGGSGSGNSDESAMKLTILYRNVSQGSTKTAQVLEQELSAAGVKVKLLGTSNADFYTKYLQSKTSAKDGTWDLAIAGWGPDWYGDAAASFFLPLFSGEQSYPWNGGSNFGLYNSDATNALIDQAQKAKTPEAAQAIWAQADKQVMTDAAIFPITDPQSANYHSKNISNAVPIPSLQQIDPLNVTKTGADKDTLHALGVGDVDYMDPSVTYYTTGYQAMRFFQRQLFNYAAIPGHTTETMPDIATEVPTKENGGISADGKTITVHMRPGVMWNTKPARPVTASDVVLGVKRSCNPVQPFTGQSDFAGLLDGYTDFCKKFAEDAGTTPTVASIKKAIAAPFKAVTAPNPTTVVYHLTQPASYFVSELTLPALSAPVPEEYLNYLPASSELAQHTISDGPYQIDSYEPTKSIVFTQNPVWKQETDPIRKQNFTKVIVDESGQQESIQQQLQAGSPSADMEWDTFPPPTSVPALKAANDPNLTITPESSSNPYVVFNTQSPNNGGALQRAEVRQALSEAMDRSALVKVLGGEMLNIPLTHILPKEIDGSQDFAMWPFDTAKAKKDLAAALKKK
jgi:ABC-type transport system substrate-binding protein